MKYKVVLMLTLLMSMMCAKVAVSSDTALQHKALMDVDSLKQKIAADYKGMMLNHESENERSVKMIALCFMVPFAIVFSFIIFVWYRQKRENEFKQQVSEVEMKALRAQINPHFIFNCMNSVNNFMQKNDTESASAYLIKFSKLIRQILENSEHRQIALKKDLDALELYMQLEQVRLPFGFDYRIKIADDIDLESACIPPMLLQPFVENCIWHGLNARESKGNIRIAAIVENALLKFTIEDNGNEVSINDHSPSYKKKSMGMSLTQERLEIFNRLNNTNAHFKISDIRNPQSIYLGKRVEVWLPFD